MSKQSVLKILNALMVLDFICLIVTIVLNDTLPREIFHRFHPLFGSILVLLAIIHFILNLSWVKNAYFKKRN